MFYPRFIKLYTFLDVNGYLMSDLASLINMSPDVLSKKMNGRTPWRIDECYAVLDALCIPYQKFHVFFPSKNEEEALINEILGMGNFHQRDDVGTGS